MQGTLADLKDVDYLLSQDIFKNPTWSDSLVQFWYKMKHNVVACNYTLSIWYPATSPICSLDSYQGRIGTYNFVVPGLSEPLF